MRWPACCRWHDRLPPSSPPSSPSSPLVATISSQILSSCVARSTNTRARATRVYTSVGRRDTFAVVCPANITGRDRPCLVHAIVSWPGLQIFSRCFLRERVSPRRGGYTSWKISILRAVFAVGLRRQTSRWIWWEIVGSFLIWGRVSGWRGSKCRSVSDTGMSRLERGREREMCKNFSRLKVLFIHRSVTFDFYRRYTRTNRLEILA